MTGALNAEGKAAQRARNAEAGMKTRSGSSGAATAVKHFPQLDWDEVDALAEHVVDVAAKMTHSQVGAGGQLTATLSVPIAYTHAVVEAHLQSRSEMLFVRMYRVPMEAFLEAMAARVVDGVEDERGDWIGNKS